MILVSGTACSNQPVTLESWQKSVEDYVWKEGNGDPNCLRNNTWAGTQRGFSVMNDPLPEDSTDANGILLAHRPVGGRTRFVFLVGLISDRKVQDVRIATLSAENGAMKWMMSPADAQATRTYREYREKMWKSQNPNPESPPPNYTAFPSLEDGFNLRVENGQLEVVHEQSGARWRMKV